MTCLSASAGSQRDAVPLTDPVLVTLRVKIVQRRVCTARVVMQRLQKRHKGHPSNKLHIRGLDTVAPWVHCCTYVD